MTNLEVGKKLVELCRKGENLEAINSFYSDNIVSIEAAEMPDNQDMPRKMEGIDAIRNKNQWWFNNHEIHSHDVKGPFPHGEDRFATVFSYDVTFKPANQRMQMEEVALFTVTNGVITKEEFFYDMGQ